MTRETPPDETNTTREQIASWLPTPWLRGTTYIAFAWGLGLGTYESLTRQNVAVLGFAGFLILLGMGLRSLAAEVFKR